MGERLKEVSNEEAVELAKSLLRDFEKEGTLVKLMSALIGEDPKQFIHNVCDISDFRVAKFGGLKKMEKVLNDFDK